MIAKNLWGRPNIYTYKERYFAGQIKGLKKEEMNNDTDILAEKEILALAIWTEYNQTVEIFVEILKLLPNVHTVHFKIVEPNINLKILANDLEVNLKSMKNLRVTGIGLKFAEPIPTEGFSNIIVLYADNVHPKQLPAFQNQIETLILFLPEVFEKVYEEPIADLYKKYIEDNMSTLRKLLLKPRNKTQFRYFTDNIMHDAKIHGPETEAFVMKWRYSQYDIELLTVTRDSNNVVRWHAETKKIENIRQALEGISAKPLTNFRLTLFFETITDYPGWKKFLLDYEYCLAHFRVITQKKTEIWTDLLEEFHVEIGKIQRFTLYDVKTDDRVDKSTDKDGNIELVVTLYSDNVSLSTFCEAFLRFERIKKLTLDHKIGQDEKEKLLLTVAILTKFPNLQWITFMVNNQEDIPLLRLWFVNHDDWTVFRYTEDRVELKRKDQSTKTIPNSKDESISSAQVTPPCVQ